MSDNEKMDSKLRYALCIVVFGVSALLVGAGSINNSMRLHDTVRLDSAEQCRASVAALESAIPLEQRAAWKALAANEPEMLLGASSMPLKAFGEN